MYQTGENWFCQKAARACPNPRMLNILRTNFFLDLKFSAMVPLLIFYNCWSFMQNRMIFSWDIGQKPHFGPNLGPNLGQNIFFENRASSLYIVCSGLTWCKKSKKSNARKYQNFRDLHTDWQRSPYNLPAIYATSRQNLSPFTAISASAGPALFLQGSMWYRRFPNLI